jgi:hypothetical protein
MCGAIEHINSSIITKRLSEVMCGENEKAREQSCGKK